MPLLVHVSEHVCVCVCCCARAGVENSTTAHVEVNVVDSRRPSISSGSLPSRNNERLRGVASLEFSFLCEYTD